MTDIKFLLEREARELDESDWAHEARIMRHAAKRIETLESALRNIAVNGGGWVRDSAQDALEAK